VLTRVVNAILYYFYNYKSRKVSAPRLRAAWHVACHRATPSYELRLPAKDGPVLAAMKELSAQYPRYGYRRIRVSCAARASS